MDPRLRGDDTKYSRFALYFVSLNIDSHALRAAFEDFHRGFDRIGVEVSYLFLGKLAELCFGYRACFLGRSLAGAFFLAGGLEKEVSCRGSFEHQVERAVFIDSDYDRDKLPFHLLRACIELGDEFTDVHFGLTESRTYRRSRVRGASH